MSNKLKQFVESLELEDSKEVLTPDQRYAWVVRMIENPKMCEELVNLGNPEVEMSIPYFEEFRTGGDENNTWTSREAFHILISDRFIMRFQNHVTTNWILGERNKVRIIGTVKMYDTESGNNIFLASYDFSNKTRNPEKTMYLYYLENISGYLSDLWLHTKEMVSVILDITRELHVSKMDTSYRYIECDKHMHLVKAMNINLRDRDLFQILKPYKLGSYV